MKEVPIVLPTGNHGLDLFCQRQFIVKLGGTQNVYYYEFSRFQSRKPKQLF